MRVHEGVAGSCSILFIEVDLSMTRSSSGGSMQAGLFHADLQPAAAAETVTTNNLKHLGSPPQSPPGKGETAQEKNESGLADEREEEGLLVVNIIEDELRTQGCQGEEGGGDEHVMRRPRPSRTFVNSALPTQMTTTTIRKNIPQRKRDLGVCGELIHAMMGLRRRSRSQCRSGERNGMAVRGRWSCSCCNACRSRAVRGICSSSTRLPARLSLLHGLFSAHSQPPGGMTLSHANRYR